MNEDFADRFPEEQLVDDKRNKLSDVREAFLNQSNFIEKMNQNGLMSPTGKKITALDIANLIIDKKKDEVQHLLDLDKWRPINHHDSIPVQKSTSHVLLPTRYSKSSREDSYSRK